MSLNNEEKNPPKKKNAVNQAEKQAPNRGLEILTQAGYKLVKGPYVPAKGDQN
jgi:hypothetical protein